MTAPADRFRTSPNDRRRLEDALIPQDLAGIDRLLGRSLASEQAGPEALPEGLVERIWAASHERLPGLTPLARIAPAVTQSGASRSLRRARVAFAAAAAVAVAAATLLALRQDGQPGGPSGGGLRGTTIIADAAPVRSVPGLESRSSGPEATLVALLDPGSIRAADGRWIDEDALASSAAGRSVVPLLQTRGTAIDDFETELGAILGAGGFSSGG
jgi:hypothetical protein